MQTQASDNQVTQSEPEIDKPVGSFPLTFAQLRLWFLEQLSPGLTSYLVPWSVRIRGRLDVAALEQSLNEVVRRHEILRTTYSAREGEPVQVVAAPSHLPLLQISLEHLQDREAEARRRTAVEATRPIDLEAGPMVRTSLLRLTEEDHLLLLTMHHISFDGWSRGIWIREMAELYEGYRDGKEVTLPDLPIQYGDYAVWQRERSKGERLAGELAYWKEQLAGAPATLNLPTDRPRPAVQTYSGASYRVEWPERLTRALKALGQREGATLFMVLLSGFQALLGRYTGQDDVVVGTPLANRSRPELERLIGYFANTIVLRTRLGGNPSFRELLAQVRETALGAYAHAELPFERLVEELEPVRSMSYNPLFQVLFSLRNAPEEEFALPGLKLEFVGAAAENAKFELSFFFAERQGRLACRVEYNTDLYDEATIVGMLGYYRVLLESVVLDAGVCLGEVGLVGEAEERELLGVWRGAEAEFARVGSVYGLFEEQVERIPDGVAVVFGEEQLSYRELNGRANQLAHLLVGHGVGRGHRVGLYVERSLEMMVGLLGIQKSGAAYVPLDPGYPADRIRQTLDEAGTSVVVVGGGLEGRLGWYGGRVLSLQGEREQLRQQSRSNPGVGGGGEDAVYVIFTSGSTGRPKGVEVAHRGVVNLLGWMGKELAMGERDVFPALASFAFDMSVPELYLSLVTGGRVVLGERHLAGNGEELAEFLRRHGATVVHATPTTWSLLLDAGYSGAGVKRVIGAEPLPQALFERLLEAEASLYNFYGPTETTVWSTYHHFRSKAEPVVIGRAIANTELYILDRHGHVCPAGVRGELYIGGEGVALGYLHRPELTAERFLPNRFTGKGQLYRTGDLVRALPDGRMEFAGRLDHQVKVRGYRIELGEIESVVGAHAAVGQCVVLARQDQPGIQRLVAYVTPRQGQTLSIPELRQLTKEKLPDYMTPAAWVLMQQLPRTPAGKIDRGKLPEPNLESAEHAGKQEGLSATEEILAGIWAEVLKLAIVLPEDDFFELGGHSLLAAQVVSRIRRTFQIELPLRTLFEATTVARLASRIEEMRGQYAPFLSTPILPAHRDGQLALSFSQERLWFVDQLEPENLSYNISHLLRLEGELDVASLQASLQEIVRRHEVLRTSFPMVGSQPVQVIAPHLVIPFNHVDLTALRREDAMREAQRLATEDTHARFDLRRGPLLRASLLKVAAREYLLVFTAHHIVTDQWSFGVLMREMSSLYEAQLTGKSCPLAELPIQYADFSQWQHEYFAQDVFKEQLAFWKTQLLDAPPLIELPTDRPRPAVQSSSGAAAFSLLPKELSEDLVRLSRREGVTLFMTLLAALKVLLARYSRQEDIVVGTFISNRNRAELESMIGFFVNTLVLRTDLSGDPDFLELLRRVREMSLSAYEHQDIPLQRLVQELRPERTLRYDPLAQVLFVMQNAPAEALHLRDVTVCSMTSETKTAKGDLFLVVTETSEGLRWRFEYKTDLFDAATIERMMSHLHSLLESIVRDPSQRISQLAMLRSSETQQLVEDWNKTHADYPGESCLQERFEEQAALRPEAVAAVFEDQHLTYHELNLRANQLARHLQGHGVQANSLVGICLHRSLDMLVAMIAVLKAGAAYVPIDPAYPAERIKIILEDCGGPVLITSQHLAGSLPSLAVRIVSLDRDRHAIRKLDAQALAPAEGGENLAYVIHTSGSTGRPKGVMIPHRAVVNFMQAMGCQPRLTESDALLAVTTLSFDIAELELWLPLCVGARVIIASREVATDGHRLMKLLQSSAATVMQATPATWRILIDAGWRGDGRLKLLCGGEALTPKLAEELLSRCGELWNMYGPTETTIWSSVCRVESDTMISLGRPIANTQFYVLDPQGNLSPNGVPGELCIGGDGVAAGYLNRPELTAERFIPDRFSRQPGAKLYRTGDLVRYLKDGQVEYRGRLDNQVKLRGHRIELGEIESTLSRSPQVAECVVLLREDTPGESYLAAYFVPSTGQKVDLLQLHADARERLPEYMIPTRWMDLSQLPRLPNGKIDRKSLPIPDGTERGLRSGRVPFTATQIRLAQIWEEVLNVSSIRLEDDFFNLGGHSLLAVKMIAKVRECFGDSPPLATLFQTSTLGGLASVLELESARVPLPTIIPIRSSGAKPALFCVARPNVNALGFIFLTRHLAQDQPVFGLQAQMKEDGSFWTYNQQDYETKAAEYISAMREVQPNGPYLLAGFCEGAHIAFEMARQLEACNVPVAMIAILDAWPIENTVSRGRFKLRSYLRGLQRWALMDRKLRARLVQAKLRSTSSPHPGVRWFEGDPGVASAEFRTMRAEQMKKRYWPGADFTPPTYGGRLTLFRTKKQDFCRIRDYQMGWGPRSLGGVDVIPIPGPHALILREPYVVDLAKKMDACIECALENAQETSPSDSGTYPAVPATA